MEGELQAGPPGQCDNTGWCRCSSAPAGALRGSSFTPELCSESRNYLQIWSKRQQRGKLFIHARVEPRGRSGRRCVCSAPH